MKLDCTDRNVVWSSGSQIVELGSPKETLFSKQEIEERYGEPVFS